jgi:hypothetical protein
VFLAALAKFGDMPASAWRLCDFRAPTFAPPESDPLDMA